MKAIVLDRFGEPGEVLQVRELPMPEPGPNQVRVRMLASPINPSDLMTVRGLYGKKPSLPATPGFEGVGVIDAAGPGFFKVVRRLTKGRRVAVLNSAGGNWAEYVVIPAQQAVPLASDIPDDQAAAFFVNPASAVVLVRNVLNVSPGSWLLQTAAGSALGRMIIRLGRHRGFRTINVVRRREQAEELRKLGGDAVICTAEESIEERVRSITGGAGVPYAIDPVGGATGSAAARALTVGGRLIVYGSLTGEPLSIESRTLITNGCRVEGFWLSHWVRSQKPWTMLILFRQIQRLMRNGVLTSEIGASFGLADIPAAVKLADTPGRQGKVLLRMGGG